MDETQNTPEQSSHSCNSSKSCCNSCKNCCYSKILIAMLSLLITFGLGYWVGRGCGSKKACNYGGEAMKSHCSYSTMAPESAPTK